MSTRAVKTTLLRQTIIAHFHCKKGYPIYAYMNGSDIARMLICAVTAWKLYRSLYDWAFESVQVGQPTQNR